MFLSQDNEVLKFIGNEIWPVLKWILLAIVSGIGAVFGWQRVEIKTLYAENADLRSELSKNTKELLDLKFENGTLKSRLDRLETQTIRLSKTEKIEKIPKNKGGE